MTEEPRKKPRRVYGRPRFDENGKLADEAIEEFAREMFDAMAADDYHDPRQASRQPDYSTSHRLKEVASTPTRTLTTLRFRRQTTS